MPSKSISLSYFPIGRSLRKLIVVLLVGVMVALAAVVPAQAAEYQNGIAAPAAGTAVSGMVTVQGIATHPAFRKWQLDLLLYGEPSGATFLALGDQPVVERSSLATWDSTLYANGNHILRLRVVHTNLNYDEYFTPVVIRNASDAGPASAANEVAIGEAASAATGAEASDPASTAAANPSVIKATEETPAVITGAVFRDDVPLQGERRIVVDLSDQTLTAWQGEEVIFRTSVSTGKSGWLTLPGTFKVQRKYEKTRMVGPGYDTPDVPWTMYYDGAFAIHGAYWHNKFGTPVSHGCVNLRVDEAKALYQWAREGDTVVVTR